MYWISWDGTSHENLDGVFDRISMGQEDRTVLGYLGVDLYGSYLEWTYGRIDGAVVSEVNIFQILVIYLASLKDI